MINATESSGFTDDGTVAVLIKVMDFNYLPIQISTESRRIRRPFEVPLSAVPLQFLVRTIGNLHAPMFVLPTPENNHHFEVYAGSTLEIEMFAEPHGLSSESLDSISVTYIQQLNIHVCDPYTVKGKVKGQNLTWSTTDSDVGTYIIQASPVDTAGINGQERNFIVTIKDVQLVDTRRGFTPMNGNFTCLQNSTCEIPIVFSAGTTVQEVSVLNSTLPGVAVSPVRLDGTVHRTDLRVLGSLAGPQQICLRVTDGKNRHVVSCVTLTIIPPDPCLDEPCGLRGRCVSHWDQWSCVCEHGYTGRQCQSEIDFCGSMPCTNGGKCFSLPPSAPVQFYCKCQPPWSGTVCDIDPSTIQPSTTAKLSTTTTRPVVIIVTTSTSTTKSPTLAYSVTTSTLSRTTTLQHFTSTSIPIPSTFTTTTTKTPSVNAKKPTVRHSVRVTTIVNRATTSTTSSTTDTSATPTPLKVQTTMKWLTSWKVLMRLPTTTTALTTNERQPKPPLNHPIQRQTTKTSLKRSTANTNQIAPNSAFGRNTPDGGLLMYSDRTTVLNVQRQIHVPPDSYCVTFIIISAVGGLLVGLIAGGSLVHVYKGRQRSRKVSP